MIARKGKMNYNKYLKCNVNDCIDKNGCILPQQIAELQSKLTRRNMQIRELKKQLAELKNPPVALGDLLGM